MCGMGSSAASVCTGEQPEDAEADVLMNLGGRGGRIGDAVTQIVGRFGDQLLPVFRAIVVDLTLRRE